MLLSILLLTAPSNAADLVVRTTVPVSVSLGNTPLVTTWGAANVRIRDLSPGLAALRIARGDRTDVIDVMVPDDGAAMIAVDADNVAIQPLTEPEAPPVVELRASRGQKFGVVLDGNRIGVVGSRFPVRLEGIEEGEHALELRSTDLTVVWMRADLYLEASDALVITGQEGYAPLYSGRPNAFQLVGASAPPPDDSAAEPQLSAPAGG